MATPYRTIQFTGKKTILSGLAFFSILASVLFSSSGVAGAAPQPDGKTLILYDAALGDVPGAPLMTFAAFPPGTALPAYVDGATLLDTGTSGQKPFAGWTSDGTTTPGFPSLDRAAGFQVDFTLQIVSESHRSNNRSGFSLIVLGEDAKGIELSFWQNRIWAQSDETTGGLFQHGEGIAFSTTSLVAYQLAVKDGTYTLTADAQPILSGPVRDYSGFDGFPDPYETPDFLFLGDDSTSAQARIRLEYVSVTGTESATAVGTSLSSPAPAASPAPLSSSIPLPSPTPAKKGFEVCPSSEMVLATMVASATLLRKIRTRFNPVKSPKGKPR